MSGVQVMGGMNLQCKSFPEIHSSAYFNLKNFLTNRAYTKSTVYSQVQSADANLVEIHELLDIQVNVQKEYLKK